MRTAPLVLLCCLRFTFSASAQPAANSAEPRAISKPATTQPSSAAANLAAHCDALLAKRIIKRPYGWAILDPSDIAPASKSPTISLAPLDTPATALLLWHAGQLLNNPQYAAAAKELARGICAAQQSSGKLPARATFDAQRATVLEERSPLPDRAPTCAALGLLLTIIDGREKENELLARSASRAAVWLYKQQPDTGAWPILYPPGKDARAQTRIVRLDHPDTRDCAFAMLLAYEVLGDALYRRGVDRSLDFLNKARNPDSLRHGASAWGSAASPSAAPLDKFPELGAPTDVLATRYALQTFLGAYLVLGQGQNFIRIQRAAKSLDDLPQPSQGQWHRFYDDRGQPWLPRAATRPTTQSVFATEPSGDQPGKQPKPSDFGLADPLQSIKTIEAADREKWRQRIRHAFTPRQVLALTLAGLTDGALLDDFPAAPATPADAANFRNRHPDWFTPPDESPDKPSAPAPSHHLWTLLLDAKIEVQAR